MLKVFLVIHDTKRTSSCLFCGTEFVQMGDEAVLESSAGVEGNVCGLCLNLGCETIARSFVDQAESLQALALDHRAKGDPHADADQIHRGAANLFFLAIELSQSGPWPSLDDLADAEAGAHLYEQPTSAFHEVSWESHLP